MSGRNSGECPWKVKKTSTLYWMTSNVAELSTGQLLSYLNCLLNVSCDRAVNITLTKLIFTVIMEEDEGIYFSTD